MPDDDWTLAEAPRRYVLIPAGAPDPDERVPLLRMWRELPRSWEVLEEVGVGDELAVEAIAWGEQKLPLGPGVASVGYTMTRVFERIAAWHPRSEMGWFACPFVKLDRFGWPRFGFWPPALTAALAKRVAYEVIDTWPKLDEPAMVYAVGQLMMDVTTVTRDDLRSSIALVIRRCLMGHPTRRFASLKQLRAALVAVGGQIDKRVVVRREIAPIAPAIPKALLALRRERSWADLAAAGAELEARRDPRGALAIYRSVLADHGEREAHLLAIARASLAAGDHGYAIDYARKLAPSGETLAIEAKAWIAKREHAKALEVIDRWEALAPGDASVHYQRGKALLGLSRLPEARAAFDTALARDGKMIAAMLLRREVDRHMGAHRAAVGTQQQQALPPELVALIGAEPADALAVLAEARFAEDPVAQLIRADLLSAEQRFAEALPCYEVALRELPQARLGKTRALLELERGDDAFRS